MDVGFELLFAHLQRDEGGGSIFFSHHRNQLIEALSSKDRPRLVRQLLEALLSDASGWYRTTDLLSLLRLETEADVLLQVVQERGLEGARSVARSLDATQSGLWNMLPDFIDRWGDDAEVCSGILRSITAIRGAYSDRSEILKPQLEVLAKLKTHSSPFVQDMIYRAEEALLKEMKERA